MHGTHLCYHHGGKTPRGIASRVFKHGLYSKSMPTALLQHFNELVNDPNLISLHEDLALHSTRLRQLLESVSNAESGELWKHLKEAKRDYFATATDPDGSQREALSKIFWLIDEGYAEYQTWNEIRATASERRKAADTERKRLETLHAMMSAVEAMTLIDALLRSVKRHVDALGTLHSVDVIPTLSAIQRDFESACNRPASR